METAKVAETEELDSTTIVDLIKSYFLNNQDCQLKQFLKRTRVRKHIVSNAWDIVPELCQVFCSEKERNNPNLLQPVDEILLHLSEFCPPKELIVILAEQIKDQKEDVLFLALLVPLQKCLLRIATKKGHSLALVLNSLYDHLALFPLPGDENFEGKERLFLDLDKNVQRITHVVPRFLEFLSPLVSQLTWKSTDPSGVNSRSLKQVKDLAGCLIRLLNHPLAFLDLSFDLSTSAKSTSRICAERCTDLLGQLYPDLSKTMLEVLDENNRTEAQALRKPTSRHGESAEERQAIPLLGLGTLSYLLFSEGLSVDCIPCVYSHQFLFEFNCPLSLRLLQRSESLVIHKGLSLVGHLLRRMTPGIWSAAFLEYPSMLELVKTVVCVASSVKSDELKELALRILLTIVKIFDCDGRVKLLRFILSASPRSGVIGYILTMITNEIDDALNGKNPGFLGPALEKLFALVFALPNGEKTDLLDNSERIMGALNILRFLLLRDGANENVTGIWNLVPLIEQKYFQVLGSGISLSRAHYQLELRKVRETRSGNQETSSMTKHQQLRVLEMAINTFDMMEGILGKVTELLQRKKNDCFEKGEAVKRMNYMDACDEVSLSESSS